MAEQEQRRLVKWKSNKKQDVVESHDKKYPADVASICLQHLGRKNLLLFSHIVFNFLYIQQTPFANNLACLLRCLFFCYKELVYYNLHNCLSCLRSSTHSENFPTKHLSEWDYSRNLSHFTGNCQNMYHHFTLYDLPNNWIDYKSMLD